MAFFSSVGASGPSSLMALSTGSRTCLLFPVAPLAQIVIGFHEWPDIVFDFDLMTR
jgi:hypothetical protein